MTGSTIVFMPELPQDRSASNLFEMIVENEEFDKIELDCLTSIDFAIITGEKGIDWDGENNPVVYDEEGGLVVSRITREGLVAVIEFTGNLDNIDFEIQAGDIEKLKAFVEKNGFDNIYELTTF